MGQRGIHRRRYEHQHTGSQSPSGSERFSNPLPLRPNRSGQGLSLRGRRPARGHRAVVVVLPFENLQNDPAQEYVADGITEETIVGLGRMGPDRLSVIGRTTSMAYRGTKRTIGDIGNDLGADYVVEGTVRAAAGRVRVSATLSRVRDQVQIWTESYERDAGDLLGLQSALGQDIAEQIHLRLSSPQRADSAPRRQTRHQRAYDLYLRGRYYYNQMTPATAERALHCFREATELDPTYSLAWAGIAHTSSSRLFNSDTRPADVIDEARAAAAAAMAAGASVAEAQTAVASIQFLFDWNWRTAEAHLRRAVALNPSSAQSYWMLGHALTQQGRHEEAVAAASRALEFDPLDALTHGMAAQIAYSAGRTDVAATHARDAYVLNQISGSAIGNLVKRANRWAEPTKRWRCSRTLCDCRTETRSPCR